MNNPRVVAVQLLRAVLHNGESLSRVEQKNLSPALSSQDRSLIRALCFGVLRWYSRLIAVSALLLERPLKTKDSDIQLLLLMGIYQLLEARVPDYAAVSETVNAASKLKKEWAKGLLNGALRNFIRNKNVLLNKVDQQDASRVAFPEWLLTQIKNDYPKQWGLIVAASNEPAPMTLRVNRQKTTVSNYLSLLQQQDIAAIDLKDFPDAIQLQKPTDVSMLPMFMVGAVSVQDCAAQLAALLLAPQKGDRLLDACAAPGGKTGHLLETQTELSELIAVDSDADRLQRVQENLSRLGYGDNNNIRLITADATEIEGWWDKKAFDRILLDAPCSGTGVIRRHPDIKWLRRASDIPVLVETQARLLRQCWKCLKPGGVLLYATCSVLKAENERQIKAFIDEKQDAEHEPLSLDIGETQLYGTQFFPGKISSGANLDGFYYAKLKKLA